MMDKRGYILIISSFLFNLVSVIVLMLRFGYPYYRILALGIYLLGYLPVIYSWKYAEKKSSKLDFVKRYYLVIITVAISLVFLWFIITLFPLDNFEILNSDKAKLEERIDLELFYLENYIIHMEEAEEKLISDMEGLNLSNLSYEEKEILISDWASYLSYIDVLNNILENNRYFYQINYIENRKLNEKSFVAGYSSFITIYDSVLNIISAGEKVEFIETILNEENSDEGIPERSYFNLKKIATNPQTGVQAHVGRVYLETINQESLKKLKEISMEKYSSITSRIGESIEIGFLGAISYFEENTFVAWFPAQKEVAELVGNTNIPVRHIELIKKEDIDKIKHYLEPGDIFVQRRNWHLSNAGLPGFWKHTAIYVSNMSILDEYFEEVTNSTNITNGLKVSNYIEENYPLFYLEFSDGELRTIEALGEGVISPTLYESAMADYLGVLRPKLSKEEKLDSLLKAIDNFGKPYDFNFDFLTDNTLVCSELFYKSYPLTNELRVVSGRLVLSTNHIVEDFDKNYGTSEQFELVYFLDGIEDERKVIYGNISDFRNSWKRTSLEIGAL